MDFTPSHRAERLHESLRAFIHDRVLPLEADIHAYAHDTSTWGQPAAVENLKQEAKSRGLWNLFAPPTWHDGGLSNVEYAPLAELTGWSPLIAPEVLNCSAPDTGNMELLAQFGTGAQRTDWLAPLLSGEIRSAFAMTEPAVASSDASNVQLDIAQDGDEWVLTGRKWWTSGAMRPDCRVLLVMGVTDPDASRGSRHSILIVPRDTPGVRILRSTSVLGHEDRLEGGHAEIDFASARVPLVNLLGTRGGGFAAAQARLGPGRIHHCMRLVGMGERALRLMTQRAAARVAFGSTLDELGMTQLRIADARVAIDAARLLVMRAAWRLDSDGAKSAQHDIAAAKIFVPQAIRKVVDDAIQVYGGAGLSQDTVLPILYAQARFLQIADGPDDVHRRSLARAETKRVASTEGALA